MVIVTFVTLITTAGFRATPGVLIVPLQQEFHWSRSTISLGISLGLLMYGVTAPFSAALMERFGVRRVMLVALTTVAAGAAATTVMTQPWQFVLLWGSSSAGRPAPSPSRSPRPSPTAVRDRRRHGILTASNAAAR